MKKSKEEIIYCRVTKEMKSKLDALAEIRGESYSILVREAIKIYLAHEATRPNYLKNSRDT